MKKTSKISKYAFRAVILAGGSGERFWPLSTPARPKQFLRVFGGKSLIRQSVERLGGLAGDVFVVTARNLVAATKRELPDIPGENVFGEPERRDTGAAVAAGTGLALRGGGDPVVGFFASDQMILDAKAFQAVLAKAVAAAAKEDIIATIGIKPSYPATCFGYISPESGKFVEKPDIAKARRYIRKGFLWNAGMFIARASVFREAFAKYAPGLLAVVDAAARPPRAAGAAAARIYGKLPKISFDYAVMEKAENIRVFPGDFGWDDVGSLAAFDRYFPHDSRGNVREGPCTAVDSEGNICVSRSSARISLLGVRDLVVIATPGSVLVAGKSSLADMKKLFAR